MPVLRLATAMDLHGCPEHLRAGLTLYLTHGSRPGGFILAVLRNDLVDAIHRADGTSAAHLHAVLGTVRDGLPADAWGNKRAVDAWRGLGDAQA